jgi:hypothetical protein
LEQHEWLPWGESQKQVNKGANSPLIHKPSRLSNRNNDLPC